MDIELRKIEKTEENLKLLKKECYEYANCIDDLDDRLNYQLEVERSKNNWDELIQTEIFEIAIGIIFENNDEYILLEP